jgi:hypothetical protein
MPARAWADFLDVYYRPHLLIVNLGTSTDSASGKKLVDLLQRLIESLQSTADYAILLEEYQVKIAFERDIDFEVARGLLVARGLFEATLLEVGGAEWASRAICTWEP